MKKIPQSVRAQKKTANTCSLRNHSSLPFAVSHEYHCNANGQAQRPVRIPHLLSSCTAFVIIEDQYPLSWEDTFVYFAVLQWPIVAHKWDWDQWAQDYGDIMSDVLTAVRYRESLSSMAPVYRWERTPTEWHMVPWKSIYSWTAASNGRHKSWVTGEYTRALPHTLKPPEQKHILAEHTHTSSAVFSYEHLLSDSLSSHGDKMWQPSPSERRFSHSLNSSSILKNITDSFPFGLTVLLEKINQRSIALIIHR